MAARDLGQLTEEAGFIHWNLADPANRDAVIGDVVDHISRLGLPYFDNFGSYDVMTNLCQASEIPGFQLRSMIEIHMCYDQPRTAERCIESWLETHTDLIPGIARTMERLKANELLPHPSGLDEEIATAVLHYQLDVAGLTRS